MDLRFVETFYWAATLASVTSAAKKMHVTAATATFRIKQVEQELGVMLLQRHGKRVQPTLAGGRFLAEAERLLKSWHDIKVGLGSSEPRDVTLRIGAIESILHSWLVDWLDALRRDQIANIKSIALAKRLRVATIVADLLSQRLECV